MFYLTVMFYGKVTKLYYRILPEYSSATRRFIYILFLFVKNVVSPTEY
jgi:hypothetical protein